MTILITGTSSGIGKYLAEHYIALDFQVIGCSRRNSDLQAPNYTHVNVDLLNEKEILKLFRFIRKNYNGLDGLINNAAVNPYIGSAALISSEAIKKTFGTNVFAPILICREAVKLMSRKKFGRIINLGSMATRHEVPGEALYTSAKAAINSYSRVLAKEVAKINITVNVVAPAAVETDLSAQIDRDKLDEVLSRNAINYLGEMSDITNVTDFLFKEDSTAVTGQLIYLGGA